MNASDARQLWDLSDVNGNLKLMWTQIASRSWRFLAQMIPSKPVSIAIVENFTACPCDERLNENLLSTSRWQARPWKNRGSISARKVQNGIWRVGSGTLCPLASETISQFRWNDMEGFAQQALTETGFAERNRNGYFISITTISGQGHTLSLKRFPYSVTDYLVLVGFPKMQVS